MDDPIAFATLAASVSGFLSPYLVKAGEALAEKIGESVPQGVEKLWQAIRARFKHKPCAEEALKDYAARPDDAKRRAAFEVQLEKVMAEDGAFAAQLRAWLEAAGGSAHATSGGMAAASGGIISVGDGNVNIAGGVGAEVKL